MSRAEKIITAIEELVDGEVGEVVAQRESLRASMKRIRAAAESDADLAKLPALRAFLLSETCAVQFPDTIIGYDPAEATGLGELLTAIDRCKNTTGHMNHEMDELVFDRPGMRAFTDLYRLAASLVADPTERRS